MDGYSGDDLDKLIAEADTYLGKPKRPKRPTFDVSALLDRIEPSVITQESSGKPNAQNPRSGARGLFQVMPSNIPDWTQKYVGRSMSPDEFLRDVDAQRKVFRGEFGRYLQRAMSEGYDEDTAIRRAAAGWYGGEKRMSRYDDPKRSRPNEPSFREYTTSILRRIQKGKNKASVNVPDDLASLLREADTFLQEPAQPQTKFDKQGNPVTAIGGEERVASEVVPQPVDEPAPAQYSPYALGKAQEALQKLAPAPQTPDNPAYLDYLKQSGMTDSNESRKAYNDAITNAPDAFRPPDLPQQQIRQPQPQLSVPNGLKPPPPRTQAQSGMVEPIRFTSDFANRRPNETFQQFFDREMLSRLRGRIPGATDYDIQRALDDSPTLDTEGQQLRESRYAGKTAGALEFEIKTDVLNRIEASVKRREAETRAKSRIDAGESDLDVLLDEQLISPESYTTAQYERQVEADNEKAAREKFLADNPTSDLTDPNFLSGVGAARFGDGSQLSSKVREQRPDTERLDDILRKYGSAQEYYKAQERIKEEYKYRPLAEPLEFAGNLARSVAAMPAYAGQFGVIALTDLNPWLKGVTAEQNPVYQALGGYRQWLEDQRNPDLDAWYVRDLPDGLGQLASQALLAPFTGGASVLLPIAQGAVEQYDAATKSNASNTSRNIATIVGGLAAVPEVLLNVRYIGKALPDNQVTQIITGWAEKLFGNLAKVLPEAEARQLTSRTIGAFLQQGVRNGVLGAATEYTQERAEDTVNKLVAKLSYKPEVSWTDVFVPNSDEQRGYLVAGIIGAFGGNVNLAIQKMSTSELQKSDAVIAKALREGRISQENAETLAREVADEARRRNVNLSPTGTVEQLVKNATDRFFAEKEASRNKVASGVFQTLQPISAPATAETEQETVTAPETAVAETIEPQTATVEPMVEPSNPTDVIAERPREMGLNITPKAQVQTAPVAETPEAVAETPVTETEAQIDELVAPTAETPPESQETATARVVAPNGVSITLPENPLMAGRVRKELDLARQDGSLRDRILSGEFVGKETTDIEPRFDRRKFNRMTSLAEQKAYENRPSRTEFSLRRSDGTGIVISKMLYDALTFAPVQAQEAQDSKKPWQMTNGEFAERMGFNVAGLVDDEGRSVKHYDSIEKALQDGKPVPAEVLAEYPDLAEKYAAKTTNERTQDVETGKQNRAESLADFYKWNSDWQSRAQQIQSQYDKTKSVKKRAELKPQADALTAERNEKTAQAMKQWRKWYAEAQSNNDLMTAHSVLRWVARNAPDEDSNISAVLDNLDGERFGDVGNILRDIATNPKVSDELRQRADAMDLARFEPEGDVDVSKPVAEMTDAELRDANRIATRTNNRDLARATFDERTRRDIAQRSRYTPKPDETARDGRTRPAEAQTENDNDISALPISQRVTPDDIDGVEFTRAKVAQSVATERVAPQTGFTQTQTEWFVGKIQELYDKWQQGEDADTSPESALYGELSDKDRQLKNEIAKLLQHEKELTNRIAVLTVDFARFKDDRDFAIAHDGDVFYVDGGNLTAQQAFETFVSFRNAQRSPYFSDSEKKELSNVQSKRADAIFGKQIEALESERQQVQAQLNTAQNQRKLLAPKLTAAVEQMEAANNAVDLKRKQESTINVPGDGTFTFYSQEGIEAIHKKLTGKTIEEFRASEDKTLRPLPSSIPDSVAKFKRETALPSKAPLKGQVKTDLLLEQELIDEYIRVFGKLPDYDYEIDGNAEIRKQVAGKIKELKNRDSWQDTVALKSVSSIEDWDSAAYDRELESITLERNKDGKILAPNGKVSNIQNERLARVIRSKNFLEWFGDWVNDPQNASKVVDENGEPLVVHHGSAEQITQFDKKRLSGTTAFGEVFSFTDAYGVAEEFANERVGHSPNILSVFLRSATPFVIDDVDIKTSEAKSLINILTDRFGLREQYVINALSGNTQRNAWTELKKAIFDPATDERVSLFGANPAKLQRVLQEAGYDSIIAPYNDAHEYAVFEPTQIKSIFNRGSFSSDDASILKSVSAPVSDLGFYSAVEQAILDKMPNKAGVDQVRSILNPQKSPVKQEEIDWLGLDEFLSGKQSVTKQELLDFVRANNVEIEEIVKDAQSGTKNWSVLDNRADYLGDREISVQRDSTGWYIWDADAKQRRASGLSSQNDAITLANDILNLPEVMFDDTKFSDYQLEGDKENYRELLLTLPVDIYAFGDAMSSKYGLSWRSRLSPEERITYEKFLSQDVSEPFRSEHFDEPNILAHVRFNERTDSDGKRVLFVEEVQSDWLQALRQGKDVPDAPFKKSWQELAMKRILRYAAENGFDKVAWTTGEQQADRYDLAKQVNEITATPQVNENEDSGNVPPTFYENVNDATLLALAEQEKQRPSGIEQYLKDFVDGGLGYSDFIRVVMQRGSQATRNAIIPFAQDVLRGGHIVTIDLKAASSVTLKVNEQGIVTDVTSIDQGFDRAVGKPLEDVIGKDPARKILEEGVTSLKGDDLKIGGEGMTGFYDRIIPSFVNKYVKKFGAKVGTTSFETGETSRNIDQDQLLARAEEETMDGDTGVGYLLKRIAKSRTVTTAEQGLATLKSESLARYGVTADSYRTVEAILKEMSASQTKIVHSVDITPSMRDSVMQGQPLFAKRDRDRTARLNETLPYETELHKVVENIESKFDDNGELELNEYASETIRRVLAEMSNDPYETSFDGVTIPQAMARKIANRIRGRIKAMDKAGYDVAPITQLVENLDKLATAKPFGIAYVFDDVLPEERVHVEDLTLGRTDSKAIAELKRSPIWAKAQSGRFSKEYGNQSEANQISEIAAKLATNQSAKYGWTGIDNFEAEKTKFLNTWADGVLRGNESTIEEIGAEAFIASYPTIGKYGKVTTGDTKGTGNQRTSASADETRTAKEDDSEKQTQADERSDRDTEAAQSDTDRRLPADGKLKKRQFAVSMAEQLFDIGDVEYEAQTEKGWSEKAIAKVEELGTDKAIDEYRKLPANESAGNKTALGIGIAIDLYQKGDFKQLTDFGRELTENIGNAAQELRAAALLSRLSPVFAEAYAERVVKRNLKRAATEEEKTAARVLAEKLADLSNKVEITQAALEQQTAISKDFEDAAKEIEQMLADERGKVADEKRKNRNLTAALKRAKDAAQRIKTPRTRTPAQNKALRKQIEAEKASLMDIIKRSLPGNVLKMVAWHGSPHLFDRFDIGKVGTGEGAQSYGWGLYFTSQEDIAAWYKDRLTADVDVALNINRPQSEALNLIFRRLEEKLSTHRYLGIPISLSDALDEIRRTLTDLLNVARQRKDAAIIPGLASQVRELASLKESDIVITRRKQGAKYKVDLKPAEDEYLLWHQPLEKQSEKVRQAIKDIENANADVNFGYYNGSLRSQAPFDTTAEADTFYKEQMALWEHHGEGSPRYKPRVTQENGRFIVTFSEPTNGMFGNATGKEIYTAISQHAASRMQASMTLKNSGIRGIKYLDRNSRSKGEGAYNYVLFDQSDIQILDINGTPITLLENDAANTERLIDALRPDIENLRDGGNRHPIGKQGFSLLDIPAQNLSLARVFRLAQNPQVRDAIIEAIPVDVVNLLKSIELTPKMLFHQPSVFGDLLTIDSNNPITGLVDMSSRLPLPSTGLRAKAGIAPSAAKLSTASGATTHRGSNESQSASVTTKFGLSDTARMKLRNGIATATATVLAHTKIVPQSFDDADVEINDILKSVSSSLDPQMQSRYDELLTMTAGGERRRKAQHLVNDAVGYKPAVATLDRGDGIHAPADPDNGAPAWDLTGNGQVYPDDVYSSRGLWFYGTGENAMDARAYEILQRLEGRSDAPVKIYRAVEKNGASKIIPGDWVTIDRRYALEHGQSALNGDYKIISKTVYARDIFTSGDSWLEWGYHPQPRMVSPLRFVGPVEARRPLRLSERRDIVQIPSDGILKSVSSSLDPQLRDAYVKLSAAKMIDEFGKPLVDAQGNKQNDPFTLAKFDEWLDGLAQQSLSPDDRAEIHAMAYDMIRPQRQTIGMDASQRTRNRMEHAKAARKIIPDQQADAIKDREAYRRDKFAQAMVETARDMGATPEETYMAFGIRELGDKRRLEPEFKREFPDANFDKTLLAGENIYKETKARLDRARIEMREGRKLSDKELFDIKHADKLNRGAAYNARRNLERYYRELAKSTGRKAADRAFDVLGLPKTLMSTGEVSFALRQGFIPFLLFNKEWREGTKGIVKGMSDPTKRIAYEQELRDDPYFTMAEHYGVAFNQIGNRARIDEHFPTKFIENLANADTKDRNIAAVGAIKAARLQQRFEHAYTLPGDAMRLGLFKNLAQVAEQSITDDPAKLEQAYKYAAYIANISVGKGSVEKVFGTDAMFTRFLNTIGFAPGYLMSRIEAGFHYSPLGIAVAYSRGGAGMAKQMARKSMRMYGSLAGAAILMQGLIAGVSGAGDGDKEPWYTIVDPNSPNFMKLRWPNGIKTDITANLSDWGKLFLPNFMASGWHAVQEAAGNDEAGFEKAVDVWGKDWNKFFGSWRYWRGKLSPTASAAAELYDGKTYLGRPITPWGMITSRTAPLTYQQAYDAFFYDPAEQFMREPETFKRGVDRLMDLNNESLSGMGKRAANSLTLFGLAGIGIGAQQYERFERSPAEEKAASIYGEIAGGGKSGRKSNEQRRIEAGLRDLFRYRDQLADKGKDTQWVTDAIKRYAQKYNVPADVRTELKDQAQTSSLKFYTQRMTAAQVREVLKYATFEEQSELLDIIKKKESNEEKRKAKGAK